MTSALQNCVLGLPKSELQSELLMSWLGQQEFGCGGPSSLPELHVAHPRETVALDSN